MKYKKAKKVYKKNKNRIERILKALHKLWGPFMVGRVDPNSISKKPVNTKEKSLSR